MSFKENLLKKIQIDTLAAHVKTSIGAPDSGRKIDKEAMRQLLQAAPYAHQRVRDLDLYVEKTDRTPKNILVLDNELPLYRTSVEDVALRKSPTVKEMVSIRNAIKILKDTDVKQSTRQATVETIQRQCIDLLDLAYDPDDIEQIAADGAACLQKGYDEGVIESLVLFAELLDYKPAPKAFRVSHHHIRGALTQKPGGEIVCGPLVAYGRIDRRLVMIEDPVSNCNREKLEWMHQVVRGNAKAAVEGPAVFEHLKAQVVKKRPGGI